MKITEFDYELPAGRIALEPARPRDAARLLVHEIASDSTRHQLVRDLDLVLAPGDLLVVNDTRVRAARLIGSRASGGQVELLLLEREPAITGGAWRALARPASRLRPGEEVALEGGALTARFLARGPAGEWRLELRGEAGGPAGEEEIERHGRMPLPPYLGRPRGDDPWRELDRESYQTVFARERGAVAAPTAGLHFTPELALRLEQRGVSFARVTLHVGEGTFRPVTVEDTGEHRMHAERYELGEDAARAVNSCRARGGRVLAVGTTSVRVLETCAEDSGLVRAQRGETALFLVPGARFRAVDALLTNFHLPRSTLLMLVAAFAGRERVLRLYAEAIERGYRFYSYGDAMLLLP